MLPRNWTWPHSSEPATETRTIGVSINREWYVDPSDPSFKTFNAPFCCLNEDLEANRWRLALRWRLCHCSQFGNRDNKVCYTHRRQSHRTAQLEIQILESLLGAAGCHTGHTFISSDMDYLPSKPAACESQIRSTPQVLLRIKVSLFSHSFLQQPALVYFLSITPSYSTMGSSFSHPTAVSEKHLTDVDSKRRPRHVVRKKSKALTALTLGCASASAHQDSPPSIRPSSVAGSDSTDSDKHSLEQPPPLYASTADLHEDDARAEKAFRAFIKQYPEYHLTWTLDALRRSDFARLDRTGETYVDYMGGSLYPDSLIRVHSAFLQRNVLGNTHSVNNS